MEIVGFIFRVVITFLSGTQVVKAIDEGNKEAAYGWLTALIMTMMSFSG